MSDLCGNEPIAITGRPLRLAGGRMFADQWRNSHDGVEAFRMLTVNEHVAAGPPTKRLCDMLPPACATSSPRETERPRPERRLQERIRRTGAGRETRRKARIAAGHLG